MTIKKYILSLFLFSSTISAYSEYERFWVSGSYLLSWFRRSPDPEPLLTTGTTGVLGDPGTVVLYGHDHFHYGTFQGVRLDAGGYLGDCQQFALEANGLYIFPNHTHFHRASDDTGRPLLARPVIDAITNAETAFLDASPGLMMGEFSVNTKSELWGAELDLTYNNNRQNELSGDFIGGFRYLDLRENLAIHDVIYPLASELTFLGNPVGLTSHLKETDSFKTANQFYGAQIGGRFRFQRNCFFLIAFGELGIGATRQTIRIHGSTTLVTPTGSQTAEGGLLALPSNIGEHHRYVFGLLPEVGVTIGGNITSYLQIFAGYSCLAWNRVVRPGKQIDRTVNVFAVPSDTMYGIPGGPDRPHARFKNSVFWAQFLKFGLSFVY